jgi:hypothetical protein
MTSHVVLTRGRAVGDEVLKNADRLTAIGTMKNPAMQSVRNLVGHFIFGLSPVQRDFADSMTSFQEHFLQPETSSGYLSIRRLSPFYRWEMRMSILGRSYG